MFFFLNYNNSVLYLKVLFAKKNCHVLKIDWNNIKHVRRHTQQSRNWSSPLIVPLSSADFDVSQTCAKAPLSRVYTRFI